jgi:hypothetical protein
MSTNYIDLKEVKSDIDFEEDFYKAVARTDRLQIITLPDSDGYFATPQEIDIIKRQCDRKKLKLLYRISHGKLMTVLDPSTKLTGIVPDSAIKCFVC